MSIATVLVSGQLYNPDGTRAANTPVRFTLSGLGVIGLSLLVPRFAAGMSDADGGLSMPVVPSPPGTYYDVRADSNGALLFKFRAVVPASDCQLSQIMQALPYPAIDASQQALIDLQAAQAEIESDRQSAAASAGSAAQSAVQTGEDVIQTGDDRVATGEDRIATGLDLAQTGENRLATGQDRIATSEDRVKTGEDRMATGQALVQTGEDRAGTGEDRIATGQDVVATGEDRIQTGEDRMATGQDLVQTGEDRAATGEDRIATGQDVTQTGADKAAASTSAGQSAGSAAQALAIYGSAAAMSAALDTAAAQSSAAQTAAASAASVLQQDLSAISAALHRSPNAITAMCIYRTELDSDGGIWCDRMQHTSWMNEPLNGAWRGAVASEAACRAISGAATGDYFQLTTDGKFYKLNAGAGVTEVFRGNRAKFPRLAAIVAEAGSVTIYDLTQPGRPMFFRGDRTSAYPFGGQFGSNTATISSVAILNAKLVVGFGNYGVIQIDFAADTATQRTAALAVMSTGIARRNLSQTWIPVAASFIASPNVNAVAMTVLPDAPFDPSTGLQVPTIAVATNGGVSVIKHDGTVVNIGTANGQYTITWLKNGRFWVNGVSGPYYQDWVGSVKTGLQVASYNAPMYGGIYPIRTASISQQSQRITSGNQVVGANVSAAGAVFRLIENPDAAGKALYASITNTQNTGYMVGDIRRAYLCNTEVESVSNPATIADRSYKAASATVYGTLVKTPVAAGAALVAWSGFSAVNYAQEPPSTDLDFGTGEWQFGSWFSAPAVLPVGSFPATHLSIGDRFNTADWARGTGWVATSATVLTCDGTQTTTIDARCDAALGAPPANTFYRWTLVVTALAGGSLTVFANNSAPVGVNAAGTYYISSSAIPSSISLFRVPIGVTCSLSLSVESHGVSAIAERSAATGPSIKLGMDAAGKLVATAHDGVTTRTVTTPAAYNTGVFIKAEATYKAGRLGIVINGVEVAFVTGAPLLTMNNANAVLTIGNSRTLDAPFPGSICLLKPGATVPTPEQSAWMYEQEKAMFQPGAQITLPAATAVTDLTYDESQDKWVTTQATHKASFTGLVRPAVATPSAGSFSKVTAGGGVELTARITTSPGVDVIIPAYGLREELVRRAEAAAKASKTLTVFDFDAIAAQVDFPLPVGWTATEVMSVGASQREGATKAWVRKYDGFRETITFAVAPGAAAWVQITARKDS